MHINRATPTPHPPAAAVCYLQLLCHAGVEVVANQVVAGLVDVCGAWLVPLNLALEDAAEDAQQATPAWGGGVGV